MLHLLLVLLFASLAAARQNVLVLGGNGFIGAEAVAALLREDAYNITILNRGSENYDVRERVFPYVTRLKCDRYAACSSCRQGNPLLGCADLVAAQRIVPQWDFVVDFSGYDPDAVGQALDALGEKMKYYVFISSDSVYEVCVPGTGVLSREESAQRPADRKLQRHLAARDAYGDRKLAAEELLSRRGVPHLVLRLPDVIGPRDTTRRWWLYQLWIEHMAALRQPVPVPPSVRYLRTSYVYVLDVARALVAALRRAQQPDVRGHAFNLALDRDFRLAELLAEMARELGVHSVVTVDVAREDVARFLPSVYRGPVSWQRARDVLGFEPTPWPEVLRDTVRFYREALVKFPNERRKVFATLGSLFEDDEARSRLMEQVEKNLLDGTFGKREEL
ncbi:uncharacterized protein LOC119114797 [Pollicipes pollicipes]|uniref:uncharacterized protein LOC119114797 n=1 Tax=Pollicipes pollicipes TaxID=41117 RepID=UPI001884BBDC|nr:uncharacterized protein LOC119114797 [Pollicipes pollicipes]XP_037094723.1 uncharacterized protein LOC119114797 [Pollicipes pollicipes]